MNCKCKKNLLTYQQKGADIFHKKPITHIKHIPHITKNSLFIESCSINKGKCIIKKQFVSLKKYLKQG